MTLAAVGQLCSSANVVHNLAACQRLVKKAVDAGAKILFLPETSDFITSDPAEAKLLAKSAETSEFVQGLQATAGEHQLSICVGVHEPHIPPPGRKRPRRDGQKFGLLKNTCLYINDKGLIRQRYQKIHLFDVDIKDGPKFKESQQIKQGNKVQFPWSTEIGILGMMICFDMRFPEISLVARKREAQVLSYASAFTIPTREAGHWSILLRARAIETQCYVMAAAQVGDHNGDGKRMSYGHSMIIDPWGKVLAECGGIEGGGKEELIVADIDREVVEKVRLEMPLKRRL